MEPFPTIICHLIDPEMTFFLLQNPMDGAKDKYFIKLLHVVKPILLCTSQVHDLFLQTYLATRGRHSKWRVLTGQRY